MLVLSRRKGEKIMVGEDVRISLVDWTPHKARLLIETRDDSFTKTFMVGDDISLCGGTVIMRMLSFQHGGRVKLGFDAPLSIRIHRSEIYNRIRRLEHERS